MAVAEVAVGAWRRVAERVPQILTAEAASRQASMSITRKAWHRQNGSAHGYLPLRWPRGMS
jgi:hypothetical protein